MPEPNTSRDEIVFEGNDASPEQDVLSVPQNQRQIGFQPKDEDVEKLLRAKQRGRLDLQPFFQRHYVWDPQKATSLIESALLGIPLPVLYFVEDDSGVRSVIDGQQRLTSFFSYIEGRFPDGTEFKLRKMQVYEELVGKKFNQLSGDLQERILSCPLRTITFNQTSDESLKFNVFERLNTGAMALNDQELRNCIYFGPYNNLLKELADFVDFKLIIGIDGNEKRMQDVELVLRFAAFYNTPYYDYRSPIKTFLNKEMVDRRFISEQRAREIRDAFKNSVSLIKMMLGAKAFRRFLIGNANHPQGGWEPKKFNVSLYDILMFGFARKDKNLVVRHLDEIREEYIDLMTTDSEFLDSIMKSTSSHQAVLKRFDKWRLRLDAILSNDTIQDRCFSDAIKQHLFTTNPICAICNQRISSIDDASVDHVVQYWRGGQTIPSNARLVHRYCNCARSRNDIEETNLSNLPTNDSTSNESELLSTDEALPVQRRALASQIRVIFPNGVSISEAKGSMTLVKVIQMIGPQKVFNLHIVHDGQPFLSTSQESFRYPAQPKVVGDSFWVNAHSSTIAKIRQIEFISEKLNLGLTVQKIS